MLLVTVRNSGLTTTGDCFDLANQVRLECEKLAGKSLLNADINVHVQPNEAMHPDHNRQAVVIVESPDWGLDKAVANAIARSVRTAFRAYFRKHDGKTKNILVWTRNYDPQTTHINYEE